MATHVYMSREPVLKRSPLVHYKTDKYAYRGEAGPADDPPSFRSLMGKRGHLVILLDARKETGNDIPLEALMPGLGVDVEDTEEN